MIRRRLMKAENQLGSIEQWYKRPMALDRNWKKSKWKKERLKGKKEQTGGALRQGQQQILPQLLVQQRRHLPSQQATIEPAPMEGVERTNVMMVREQKQEVRTSLRRNPYIIEVDRGKNCYACREFRYMAYYCRNRGRGRVIDRRRLEYGGWNIEGNHEHLNHLKEEENLESLDQILIIDLMYQLQE